MMMSLTPLAFGQQQDELKQFEINPQREVETVKTDEVVKRKSDGALLRISGINEKMSGSTPEEVAKNYVTQQLSNLGFQSPLEQNIRISKIQELNSGTVIRFRQYHQGLRVDRNEIVLKLNRQHAVRSVQNSTLPIKSRISIEPEITKEKAVNIIKSYLKLKDEPSFQKTELMIHMVNLHPFLCWQVNLVPDIPHADWECYVDATTAEIVEVKNIACNVNGTGNVFSPSPTYSAGSPYGTGNFIDANDATNVDLEGEMINVILLDIEEDNGTFRLNGPYASVFPANSFDQTSSDFSFTRDQDGFEATMCYYYIDQSMRYINEDLNVNVEPAEYSGGVRFDPHISATNAFFSPSTGQVSFGDGSNHVDAGEDALIILHELGHGIHHWQTGENHSTNEGLSEGISDYWGMSGTRECGNADTYNEWEPEYHQVFHWGLMPAIDNLGAQRTTNFTDDYCASPGPGNQPSSHASGQWISTALMRIYNDLGKFKTDQLVIEAMPLWSGNINLQEAGADLYQTAIDLNYSDNDLCIIYQHLDDVLCIGSDDTNVSPPVGNMGNVYMKDTECDNGEEVNSDNGPMWLSEDIWVRHENDGVLEHQNPEYKVNSPNWVYVRIRGIGCNSLNDAQLRLYFSKASTGLIWPTMWNDFFLMGPNGLVLAGDEITTTPVDIPAIEPGGEWIVSIPWYPPNPADFNTEIHHWCLLARIISEDDPMFIAETSAVGSNTRNNNNIAWKNVSVFDNDPNNIVQGPISVYIGCSEELQGGRLGILSAQNSLGKSIHEMGNVYVELKEPMKTEWVNGGMAGEGFLMTQDGRLKVQNESFKIEGISIVDCNQYVNVYFEPFNTERFAAFDLVQFDNQGVLVGGERFEYRPQARAGQRSDAKREGQIVQSDILILYPNPTTGVLNVTMKDLQANIHSLEIFDLQGRKVVQTATPEGIIPGNSIQIDVSSLTSGLYLLIAKNENGKHIDDLKFMKE